MGAAALGYIPWVEKTDDRPAEIERAYKLSQDLRFKRGARTGNLKIAKQLDYEYHGDRQVRSAKAVKRALQKHRKSLE